MKPMRVFRVVSCFAIFASVWCLSAQAQKSSVKVGVFATGLSNPRGLKFGPDGNLYVAEAGFPAGEPQEAPAGLGGDCSAGANGPGNYFGSTTGSRIAKVDAGGNVTTFVDSLPSSEPKVFPAELPTWRSLETPCTRFTPAPDVHTACPLFRTQWCA